MQPRLKSHFFTFGLDYSPIAGRLIRVNFTNFGKFNYSEGSTWCLLRSSYSCLGRLPTTPFILSLFHCQLSTSLPHLSPPSLLDTHARAAKWVLLMGGGACKVTLARANLSQTNQHTWFTYHRAGASLTTRRTRQERIMRAVQKGWNAGDQEFLTCLIKANIYQ